MPEPGTLADLVEHIDRYLSMERSLFELTGRATRSAVVGDEDHRAIVVLGELSAHAAQRLDWWLARRPTVGLHGEPWEASNEVTGVCDVTDIDGAPDPAPSACLQLVVTSLLPDVVAAYHHHREAIEDAVDAPTATLLELVLWDTRRDLARGTKALARNPYSG